MAKFSKAIGCLLGLLSVSQLGRARLLKASGSSASTQAESQFMSASMRSFIKQGIQGYLYNNQNYSSFLAMAGAVPNYQTLLNGAWSKRCQETQGIGTSEASIPVSYMTLPLVHRVHCKGPTNNTVLIPTNDAIATAFQELGDKFSVNSNVSNYLNLVNSTLGLRAIQTPLQTLFSAILNSHVLPEPLNLYATPQVLDASANNPYQLPATGLSVLEAPVAYADSNQTVFIQEPMGLLSNILEVPQFYAQQRSFSNTTEGIVSITFKERDSVSYVLAYASWMCLSMLCQQGNSTLYLYEVDTVLVASNVLNGTESSSTEEALKSVSTFID